MTSRPPGLALILAALPPQFDAFVKSGVGRWAKVIEEAGIRAD